MGKNIITIFKNILSDEISGDIKLTAEPCEQAIDRRVAETKAFRANAIIDVRFLTSYIIQSAAEILVYGNGVFAE